MTADPMLVVGTPLEPAAVECLRKAGLLPPKPRSEGPAAASDEGAWKPMTPQQAAIWEGLTDKPLNANQARVLEIYWNAYTADEPPLSVAEVARRLMTSEQDADRSIDLVKGSLRSFGRRLLQAINRTSTRPIPSGMPTAENEKVPLLNLLSITTGPQGEARHRLTADGAVAVGAALGLAEGKHRDASSGEGDFKDVIAIGMAKQSATMLLRLQRTWGMSIDQVIQRLIIQAGGTGT